VGGGTGGGWPAAAGLDPVRRLVVLAGAAGRAVYAERYFDAPVDEVWRVASDLEAELPQVVRGLRSFTLAAAPEAELPERFTATAVSRLRHRERFDVVLRPGWCLMQSRTVVGGMAATRQGSGTRFALMYRLRVPGGRGLQRLMKARARADAMLDRLGARIADRRTA
jgi:hypothetical protein